MHRPAAITAFERLYLGSILLYAVLAATFWSRTQAMMLESPQIAANPAMASFVTGIMVAALVATIAISILFWWLVTRQHSGAGKWLVVGTEAIGALFGLWALVQLSRGLSPNPLGVGLGLVSTALAVAAAAMLLRADAAPWFADEMAPLA